MTAIPCTIYRPRNWPSAKKLLDKFSPRWIFRGQTSATWSLVTSLERALSPQATTPRNHFENVIYWEFRRRAHHYLGPNLIPREDDHVGWQALMQHHGAPTRLLDWTYSPYVAAYFALEDCSDRCAIWAVDRWWLHDAGVKKLRALAAKYKGISETELTDPKYVEAVLHGNCSGIFTLEPLQMNERLSIQQGVFLYPGNLDLSFAENLRAMAEEDQLRERVVQISLPRALRSAALDDLRNMNVSRATLFPGLDGFAQSLKYLTHIISDASFMRKKLTGQLQR